LRTCAQGLDDAGELREWRNYPIHFDNFFSALRAMFILATFDEWCALSNACAS
jgi:hypothetical protein